MIKNLVVVIALIFVFNLSAQDSKISVTIAYPLPVGDNSVSDYTGVVDIGLQARFIELGPIQMGISANIDYLTNSYKITAPQSFNPVIGEELTAKINESAIFIQPRIFAELNLPGMHKLKPFLGLGYSYTNFKSKNDADGEKNTGNFGGANINLGAAFHFSKSWFAHLQYDHIRQNRDFIIVDPSFFNKISLIKLGLGYRF